MNEIEDALKESPIYLTLPPQERKSLVEEIYRRYITGDGKKEPQNQQ